MRTKISWESLLRWLIPATASLAFVASLSHTSGTPAVLGRYSTRYFLFLLGVGLVAVTAWKVAFDPALVDRLSGRMRQLPVSGFLVTLAGLLVMVDIMIPLTTFPVLALLIAVTLLVWFGLRDRRNPLEWMNTLALFVAAIIAGLVIAEGAFRVVFLDRLVPVTEEGFQRVIASTWPEDRSYGRASGVFRIMGLADSFGQAGGLDNYHYLLERFLREDGLNVEVVNLSLGGYEPPDQLKLLRRWGSRYAPDLIVHGFFVGNDFSMPVTEMLGYGGMIVRPAGGMGYLRPRNFTVVEYLRRYVKLVRHERLVTEERVRDGLEGTFTLDEFLRIERSTVDLCDAGLDRNREWQPTLDTLHEIRREAGRLGAAYMMVIHPGRVQVEPKLRQQLAETYMLDLERYEFDAPQRFLKEDCRMHGVPCLDLLPIFRREGAGEGLYLVRGTHYNFAGNELAALSIVQFLRDRNLLPASLGDAPTHGHAPEANVVHGINDKDSAGVADRPSV